MRDIYVDGPVRIEQYPNAIYQYYDYQIEHVKSNLYAIFLVRNGIAKAFRETSSYKSAIKIIDKLRG